MKNRKILALSTFLILWFFCGSMAYQESYDEAKEVLENIVWTYLVEDFLWDLMPGRIYRPHEEPVEADKEIKDFYKRWHTKEQILINKVCLNRSFFDPMRGLSEEKQLREIFESDEYFKEFSWEALESGFKSKRKGREEIVLYRNTYTQYTLIEWLLPTIGLGLVYAIGLTLFGVGCLLFLYNMCLAFCSALEIKSKLNLKVYDFIALSLLIIDPIIIIVVSSQ